MRFLKKLTGFLMYVVVLGTIGYAVYYLIDLHNNPAKYGWTEADPMQGYKKLLIVGIIAVVVIIALGICRALITKKMKELGISNLSKKDIKAGIVWKARRRNAIGLPWTLTVYLLDQDRLYVRNGLLNSREDEVRLYRIVDMILRRTLWQKIVRMGTIHCESSDTTLKSFDLKNIRHSREVKAMLAKLIDESRIRNKVYSAEPVTGGSHGPGQPFPDLDRTDADGNGIPDVFENEAP